MEPDLVVIHEHPEWQKPLFQALERRGVSYAPFDLKQAAFSNVDLPARGSISTRPAPAPTCAAMPVRFPWPSPTCARWSGEARGC